MFHAKKILNQLMAFSLFVSLGFVALGFTGSNAALAAGPAPVDLLSAGDFVVLGETAITTTGATSIVGDVGISPNTASSITGFGLIMDGSGAFSTSALVSGKIYAANYTPPTPSKLTTAVNDMLTAYNNAAAVVTPAPVTELGGGNIGGKTLAPGLYKWSTDVSIPTNLTLSGGASDVWIFQIGGDLDIASGGSAASGIKILLSGGARAENVFWQVGGVTGATLGTYSTFEGIILSAKQIILQTGAVMNGKALAQTQVTLDADTITAPCPLITLTPPPLAQGIVGTAYSRTITASGATGYSITAGALPTGLTFTPATGLISGTPTTSGTFTFTVTATDASGCTGLQAYTIVINAATCPVIPLLPAPPLPLGTVGTAYSRTITASGATGYSITAGALPTGLTFTPATGLISGTPTTSGTFTFTVTATDASGCTGLQAYTIVINSAVMITTITPIPTLSEWAMILLATLLAIAGYTAMRKQAE
jgi:hypothetical protein